MVMNFKIVSRKSALGIKLKIMQEFVMFTLLNHIKNTMQIQVMMTLSFASVFSFDRNVLF